MTAPLLLEFGGLLAVLVYAAWLYRYQPCDDAVRCSLWGIGGAGAAVLIFILKMGF